MIDSLLVTAEEEAGKRFWALLHLKKGRIDVAFKAVGTVNAVNIGSMFRNGWNNNIKSADAISVLENGSKARTAEAGGAATVTVPLAPLRKEDAPNKELEEAWE